MYSVYLISQFPNLQSKIRIPHSRLPNPDSPLPNPQYQIPNTEYLIPNPSIPNPQSKFLFPPALLAPYLFVGLLNRFAEHIDVQGLLQVGKSAQIHT